MRNRLEEVMRQEMTLRTRELDELQARHRDLKEGDVAGEQALKRAAEMDHVEEELMLAQCRQQTLDNFFRRLQDEVLGGPQPEEPPTGVKQVSKRAIYDRPQA